MAYNSIAKVKRVKNLIKEIVINRWSDTEIKERNDCLFYDIQHKYEKVSYEVWFEIKDDVMNIVFRSKPYEEDELLVDIYFAELVRYVFLQQERKGFTGISIQYEESEYENAVIPVICFQYWIFLDIEDEALEETMKTLMEVIVPNDCVQLIKFLRKNPEYLA